MRKLIPHNYQVFGSSWLAVRKGAILGDQVGLGKSLQAIEAYRLIDAKMILIVCPLAHKKFWLEEIADVEQIKLTVSRWTFPIVGGKTGCINAYQGGHRTYILAHYEQFRSKRGEKKEPSPITKELVKVKWDVVIRDEAHRGKTRDSQQFKWFNQLQAKFRWALTGSPIAERPDDLWSILHWVDRKEFPSYWAFVRAYQVIDVGYNHKTKGDFSKVGAIKPPKDVTLKLLRERVKDYLLVRTREDVGIQLPPLRVAEVPLDMGEEQANWYTQVEKETFISLTYAYGDPDIWDLTGKDQLIIRSAVARYTRLLQSASDPSTFKSGLPSVKLDWVKNYFETDSPPAVIATRYTHTVEKIKALAAKMGRKGDIIGTFKGLAESHNFQYLSIEIAVDPPESRLTWEQFRGRIERQGQQNPMTIYRLRCADAMDSTAWDGIDNKQDEVEIVLAWLRRLKDETTTNN